MRDFLVEYSESCLIHHGILGQKWGVRRYQNKDGSLTPEGRKRYSDVGDAVISIKNDKHKNVDKWGSDEDHNLLIIIGLSGSGKSTSAGLLKKQLKNVDVIHLDVYYDNPTRELEQYHSKGFDQYLFKKVPNYKKIVDNFEQYDAVRLKDEPSDLKTEYWKTMDQVRDAMFEYSRDQYGKNRVVAEGIQWLDTSMYPDKSQKFETIKDMPIIVKGTGIAKSTWQATFRDIDFSKEGLKSINAIIDRYKSNKIWNSYIKDFYELL